MLDDVTVLVFSLTALSANIFSAVNLNLFTKKVNIIINIYFKKK